MALEDHPALRCAVRYTAQKEISHPQRMRLRSDCSPWGIPLQGLISIGLSYKCVTACLCTLLRHSTHPCKMKNPTCIFIKSYFMYLYKRSYEKSQYLFWYPGVSSFYFITISSQCCHLCCWWKSLVPGSSCPHKAGTMISEVRRGTNKIQAQLWVIAVSLLTTPSLLERIDIWFPDIKFSLVTKYQWCS